ncbi:MAG: hypothetical protein ACKOUM_00470, partial [Sphingopyxis sp.]
MNGANRNPFDARVVAGLIVAGLIGFVGYLAMSAFAPEMGGGQDGGTHALSRSATGFAGLAELAQDAGMVTSIVRWRDEPLDADIDAAAGADEYGDAGADGADGAPARD